MRELDIERDDRFIAVERTLHRAAVAVMALVVLAGALGVFGLGPLSSATRTGTDYTVTYDRFARNGAPLQLTVESTDAELLRVWIDDALLDATLLERVVPVAASEQRTSAGATFTFDTPTATSDTATFALIGDAIGVVRARVGRSPDDAVSLTIVFYP